MNKITMLGTGNATVTHIYNTCFILSTATTRILVDAGGGNGILTQLRKANVAIRDIHHLYVTHAHTDHVLGVIWVIRMVAQCKDYENRLHIYGNDKVMKVVHTIFILPRRSNMDSVHSCQTLLLWRVLVTSHTISSTAPT